jgi:hypothetical protein
MVITRRTTREGAVGSGRWGGRGGRPKPKATHDRKKKQTIPEQEPTPVSEGNNINRGNRVEVDPAVRVAISNEVYQALHDTMLGMLAEAMRAMGGRKDEAKKKKPTPEMQVITSQRKRMILKIQMVKKRGDATTGLSRGAIPHHSTVLKMLLLHKNGCEKLRLSFASVSENKNKR